MTIYLNQPIKPNMEKLTQYLTQVNESGWYTNLGPLHKQLTKRLEEYLGVKNLLLVSNGTLALQVAYKTLGVTNALTTPFTFVATASSLIWQGIETSFSDVDKETYNLCPQKAQHALDENSEIDTIVATHVYGNPCDVGEFDSLVKKTKTKLIYDAAHAFGVNVGDKSILDFGDASTLSFHATKVFHTVEGGAIVFKRQADFERAKRLINFGLDEKGNITEAGINAKLNEYQCAVGLTILDDIESVLVYRANLFNAYRKRLEGVVEMPMWHDKASYNGSYMPIKLKNTKFVDVVEHVLNQNNIQSRRYFSESLDIFFKGSKNDGCENSKKTSQCILCLPLHYYMTIHDVMRVSEIIINVLSE